LIFIWLSWGSDVELIEQPADNQNLLWGKSDTGHADCPWELPVQVDGYNDME